MFPSGGEVAVHLKSGEDGIGDGPGLRLIAKQSELDGHGAAMGFDEVVDPAGERGEHGFVRSG